MAERSGHLKELSITYVPLAPFQDAVELEMAVVNLFSLHLPFLTKQLQYFDLKNNQLFCVSFSTNCRLLQLKINDNFSSFFFFFKHKPSVLFPEGGRKKKKYFFVQLLPINLNCISTTLSPFFCSSTQNEIYRSKTTWPVETIILQMKHCVVSFTTITGSQSVRTYWAIIG